MRLLEDNVIRNKTFNFSVRIVNLYKILISERAEYVLSKQLLRSGTSIGANVEEAMASISGKEFIAKIHISYKEGYETRYWIKLLHKTEYINDKEYESMITDIEEIIKILTSILKTSKSKLNSISF